MRIINSISFLKKSYEYVNDVKESSYVSCHSYLNAQNELLFVGSGLTSLLGFSKSQLRGQLIDNLILDDDVDELRQVITQISAANPFCKVSSRMVKSDGSIVRVGLFLTHSFIKNGCSILLMCKPEKEEYVNSNKILREQEYLYILEENATIVQVLLDQNFQNLYVSPSCKKLIGYDSKLLLDADLYRWIHPDDFDKVWGILHYGGGDLNEPLYFRVRHIDGHYLIVQARIVKTADDFNENQYIAIYLQDATAFKNQERDLLRSQREVKQAKKVESSFLASISHEFRTPLNVIIGFARILDQSLRKFTNKDYVAKIETSGLQLLDLVDNLLMYSMLEKSEYKLQFEKVDLDGFFRNLALDIKGDIEKLDKKNIELICDWDINALTTEINVDVNLLKKIFVNLLGNAFKFTNDGYVRYGCRLYGIKSYLFFVEDSGIGISVKDQERIFETFHQSDGSLTKEYGGTGIGLSVTKRMIDLLGGNIWVTSEEGKGASLFFTFPF